MTGYKIYQSAIPFNGRLSWVIHDLRTERSIPFTQNNIYEDGLQGLFDDLDDELMLPDELFVANEFSLTFDEDGEITEIYSFLYGNNEDGELESYLIDYDADEDDEVTVRLEGYVDATYDSNQRIQPLIDDLDTTSLKEYAQTTAADSFNIYYDGYRASLPYFERDVFYNDEEMDTETREVQIAEEYYLEDDIGYQLVVLDAALGSRFYGLDKTEDSGTTWNTINSDPFLGETGVAAGLTFINENLGFISLSHNGGRHADLFKTTDGGATFEKVNFPSITVEQNGTELEPFDFPQMPYQEGENLVLLVNQGTDGDYNKGAQGVFLSTDSGQSWEYQGEK